MSACVSDRCMTVTDASAVGVVPVRASVM